jgi:hypothetical protein
VELALRAGPGAKGNAARCIYVRQIAGLRFQLFEGDQRHELECEPEKHRHAR